MWLGPSRICVLLSVRTSSVPPKNHFSKVFFSSCFFFGCCFYFIYLFVSCTTNSRGSKKKPRKILISWKSWQIDFFHVLFIDSCLVDKKNLMWVVPTKSMLFSSIKIPGNWAELLNEISARRLWSLANFRVEKLLISKCTKAEIWTLNVCYSLYFL